MAETKGQAADFCRELGVDPHLLDHVQLHVAEVRPIVDAIRQRPGCALLVFGCGNDSKFWEAVNGGGATCFLEDDLEWAIRASLRLTSARVATVTYTTRLGDWKYLLDHPEKLAIELPTEARERRWDVILIDGPHGYEPQHPGRMQPIFAAPHLVAPGGMVFVHDCERPAEAAFTSRYLGNERIRVDVRGRALLRGFVF